MGILKKFFWILIVRIISEFWAQESLSKSQKNIFVCTTYVVQYTTFVGQSYHICGILYHKRGILYHKREFPGNPYTVISKYCVADLQVWPMTQVYEVDNVKASSGRMFLNMKLCTSFGHSFFVTIYQYVFAPKFKNQYLILNCHCPFKNANQEVLWKGYSQNFELS